MLLGQCNITHKILYICGMNLMNKIAISIQVVIGDFRFPCLKNRRNFLSTNSKV